MQRAGYFIALALIASCSLERTPFAHGASFRGIGDLEGGGYQSLLFGVSADGKTAVGHSTSERGMEAISWRNGVTTRLGDVTGGEFASLARDVSADGKVIIGTGNWTTEPQAVIWVDGNIIPLGDLPGGTFHSQGEAISADGRVVAGTATTEELFCDYDVDHDVEVCEYRPTFQAFRWESGLMVGLGKIGLTDFSRAFGISGDGRLVVGDSTSFGYVNTHGEGFRFENGTMIGMGGEAVFPVAASFDGQVIVGQGYSETNGFEAVRWENGIVHALGPDHDGYRFTTPDDVSSDGNWIIGRGDSESGYGEAFIWDSVHGSRQIADVLFDDFGISTDGWRLLDATGISDDGRTIVGNGWNPNGDFEAWIVHIPEPSTIVLAVVASVICGIRFQSRIRR